MTSMELNESPSCYEKTNWVINHDSWVSDNLSQILSVAGKVELAKKSRHNVWLSLAFICQVYLNFGLILIIRMVNLVQVQVDRSDYNNVIGCLPYLKVNRKN